jgi:hypothetical protein
MENLETRLNEVARIAVRLEQQTACPAQLLIAQWAIRIEVGRNASRPRQLHRDKARRPTHKVMHGRDA